ncbi:hypothetical protein A1D18_06505 [Candidatus Rickettsiella isopodorum]|jgi:hypothetical protein|uniref:Uncharacterized protein n=1 Tax=Candidatus Rickettsiella isopodorum TaxID=1225476 RepID=A0A1J8NHW4_9COXI|nr:ankyrin repeat domain-containing protein [Candidatus Rickettsiella isopodorum]MCH9754952.1 ankyrin repeat domain-containing protein [Gammaproteobacteria bacterium]MDD5161376.1 ankyrin repeat domain-containing protein [Candidatus Rickettsiella isopodorum]MDQ5899431.1 hypothetical protein [Pseudomonadota bacterium]OIZ94482.1 hypothetical protein A1D18_06505 [Candidatus Rickettsiella isopodorum]
MISSNFNWENNSLFTLANIGDVQLFEYWLNKKKLNIDAQDEDGDTPLHYAAKRGHKDLVINLLNKGAIISSNKKKRTALQDAYACNQAKVAKEITKFVVQKNSVKNILQFQKSIKVGSQEKQELDRLANGFIQYLRKNYLDRNIFIRFSAKHTRRANLLIIAARRCSTIKEFKDLLNNQLNLFKGVPANSISKAILDKRWSEEIRNKPKDLNKSLFYKTITTFVVERLSNNNVNNRSIRDVSHR